MSYTASPKWILKIDTFMPNAHFATLTRTIRDTPEGGVQPTLRRQVWDVRRELSDEDRETPLFRTRHEAIKAAVAAFVSLSSDGDWLTGDMLMGQDGRIPQHLLGDLSGPDDRQVVVFTLAGAVEHWAAFHARREASEASQWTTTERR